MTRALRQIADPFAAAAPGEKFSYRGTHYQLTDSPALPKPVQRPRPPVIIGGHGPRRTPALAARHADEFNIAFSSVGAAAAQVCYLQVLDLDDLDHLADIAAAVLTQV